VKVYGGTDPLTGREIRCQAKHQRAAALHGKSAARGQVWPA